MKQFEEKNSFRYEGKSFSTSYKALMHGRKNYPFVNNKQTAVVSACHWKSIFVQSLNEEEGRVSAGKVARGSR